MDYSPFIDQVNRIAIDAGLLIMGYYKTDVDVTTKDDNSPVTQADIAANNHIVKALKSLTPDIPVVSEEGPPLHNQQAAEAKRFWCVDPLDGTKSFIRKSGEFTVNIALIEQGKPIFGVVYIPAKEWLYYNKSASTALKQEGSGPPTEIVVRSIQKDGIQVVASHSHLNQATQDFIAQLPNVKEVVPAASSQKFCIIAEGKADIYPRFGPTMEWDTAAGHAVLLAAGGAVVKEDQSPVVYGKRERLNPNFIAYGDPASFK